MDFAVAVLAVVPKETSSGGRHPVSLESPGFARGITGAEELAVEILEV